MDPAPNRPFDNHRGRCGAEVGERQTAPAGVRIEQVVIGRLESQVVREQLVTEVRAEARRNPPQWLSRRTRGQHCGGVLARDERVVLIDVVGDIGAFELSGAGQQVCGMRGGVGLDHIGHREHVEPRERGGHAWGVGQRARRIAADHDQGAQVPRFDLVDERGARVLSEEPGQVGAARRTWPVDRLGCARAQRATVEAAQKARVEPQAARLLVTARDDLQRPHEPFGRVRSRCHRGARTGYRSHPSLSADRGDEILECVRRESGVGDGACEIERVDRRAERHDVGGVGVPRKVGVIGTTIA